MTDWSRKLGGPPTPGIGFGLGIERLLMVLESLGIALPEPFVCDVYVCTMGGRAALQGFGLAGRLRAAGVKTECDHIGRSLKAQLKYANKLGRGARRNHRRYGDRRRCRRCARHAKKRGDQRFQWRN